MSMTEGRIAARLAALYNAPGRFHHVWLHAEEMLAVLDRMKRLVRNKQRLKLAVWFHDAVYDSRARDNEERSAALAVEWLAGMESPKGLSDISTMIIATKFHKVPTGISTELADDIALLIDADLAILGASPERFEMFDANVRREYAWVGEEDWRAGRSAVLRSFLERQAIFLVEPMRDAYEVAARENIERKLAQLTR